MVDHARARRLAVRIREIVATTLENRVKDPRLGMVTITDVTPDRRSARRDALLHGLRRRRRAGGVARRHWTVPAGCCAPRSGARPGCGTPPLWPSSPTRCRTPRGTSMNCSRGPAPPTTTCAGRGAGAQPAGDPDPYRHPTPRRPTTRPAWTPPAATGGEPDRGVPAAAARGGWAAAVGHSPGRVRSSSPAMSTPDGDALGGAARARPCVAPAADARSSRASPNRSSYRRPLRVPARRCDLLVPPDAVPVGRTCWSPSTPAASTGSACWRIASPSRRRGAWSSTTTRPTPASATCIWSTPQPRRRPSWWPT